MNDPLVVALAAALEVLLARGVEVTPCGDGWTIKLAQDDCSAGTSESEHRRTW